MMPKVRKIISMQIHGTITKSRTAIIDDKPVTVVLEAELTKLVIVDKEQSMPKVRKTPLANVERTVKDKAAPKKSERKREAAKADNPYPNKLRD
jgi:hypothetical protein